MATLSVETITRVGLVPTLVSAAGGGDKFPNSTKRELLIVKNGDVSPTTVTLDIKATVDDQAVTDKTVVVAAGDEALIGPFDERYQDNNGDVNISYSNVTAITVGVVKL